MVESKSNTPGAIAMRELRARRRKERFGIDIPADRSRAFVQMRDAVYIRLIETDCSRGCAYKKLSYVARVQHNGQVKTCSRSINKWGSRAHKIVRRWLIERLCDIYGEKLVELAGYKV